MTEEQWRDYQKRSKDWFIRMGFRLLHSEAYKNLTYAPALKVLNFFHEKIRYQPTKGKHGKNRYDIVNNGEMNFTYREAALRGLNPHQFRNALMQLCGLGFIDVKKPGSALKGDYAIFTFSERWKQYGTTSFEAIEFPKSIHWVNFGFGSKKKKVRCRN